MVVAGVAICVNGRVPKGICGVELDHVAVHNPVTKARLSPDSSSLVTADK